MRSRYLRLPVLSGLLAGALAVASVSAAPANTSSTIALRTIGRYATGIPFNGKVGAAEIAAHDPASQRLFIVNAVGNKLDVLDIRNPASPTELFAIDLAPYGRVNSADVHGGVVAAALENGANKQANGQVVFFTTEGQFLSAVTAGALPDMVTFTPNGEAVLVANEGEPNDAYTDDPEGSISIIDVRGGAASVTQANVRTVGFADFNTGEPRHGELDPGIRIYGPGATVAKDLEPEYIAVSHNSLTAWVTLQENNAIATIDIKAGTITKLTPLGFKDHSSQRNGLDASDGDSAIKITPWPVKGMYQPDAIAAYQALGTGETFLVTANEGDSRDYLGSPGYSEEKRVGKVALDSNAFPNASTLKAPANLGRLKMTKANGDTDDDGDFDEIYSFGARSFSIWTSSGELVFDSGDDFERITATSYPTLFNGNSNSVENVPDDRSDDKGPEPEGVTTGRVAGRTYAFIGLERIGGIMVYDVTNPGAPKFVQYLTTRVTDRDFSPEGLHFISEEESPTGGPLLVVAHEVSGSTVIFEITRR